LNDSPTQPDRRAQRRAARRAQSRTEILDAAERVFGEDGIRDGSLRNIAALAGFSTAAIYLFFENKQQLVSETLTRRGDELNGAIRAVAESDLAPLDKLHQIMDDTTGFFAERPHFRLLIRHIRGGATITGPVLAEFASDVDARFREAMTLLAGIVRDGQEIGQIRDGNERAIAHMYSVLVNEFILLDPSPDGEDIGALTSTQFHGLIDGAFRSPSPRTNRASSPAASARRRG
jgi:TetR/AcrR family transcriptional regulator